MNEIYSDDLNPKYLFQTIRVGLLVSLIKDKVDMNLLVRKELANRSLDLNGEWIGPSKAEALYKKYENANRKKSKGEKEFDKIKDKYMQVYKEANGHPLKSKVTYSDGFIYVPASFGLPHKHRLNEFKSMIKNLEDRIKEKTCLCGVKRKDKAICPKHKDKITNA